MQRMKTEWLNAAEPADLERAGALLKSGELVAVPTETVYGLAADAENPRAVARIFEAKQRPRNHPLIVHLAGADQLLLDARCESCGQCVAYCPVGALTDKAFRFQQRPWFLRATASTAFKAPTFNELY